MAEPESRTEDYALVRTDDIGTMYMVLETEDLEKLEPAFEAAARRLTVGERLDAMRRTTEILLSAVGVDPSE